MTEQAANGVGVLDRIEYQINTSFLRFIRFLIFPIGVSCMVVAGYFLIQGFLQIGGNDSAKNMWIVLGILFQIGESACFVSAAAFTNHSLYWRYSALGFGILLFMMSIGVMTLAQKTAMFAGENQATAVDQQRNHIQSQIDSLDELIASYRLNAEKQSQSIYAQSRALGQESLNKAAELEEKKLVLSNELFALTVSRKQTSMDFFTKVEGMFGYDAQKTEFAFYVARSLFVEGLGIFLMALGAHQYSRNNHMFSNTEGVTIQKMATNKRNVKKKKVASKKNKNSVGSEPPANDIKIAEERDEAKEASRGSVVTFPSKKTELSTELVDVDNDIEDYTNKILALRSKEKINRFGRESIRKALNEHHNIQIGSAKAKEVAERVKKFLE